MNEFVEQFLLEARELVEQATGDLLALEEKPDRTDRLDGAFRAFHTLKGAASIVDFDAMARSLHAAEDVLSRIRAGSSQVTPALIGDCLTCLDQVVQWLDVMEGDGNPPADAAASADAIVRRFDRHGGAGLSEAPRAPKRAPATDWLRDLLLRYPGAAEATVGLNFVPEPDCFFHGEDPAALLAGLPGLIALDIVPAGRWPDLDSLDPFTCQVIFRALVAGSAEVVGALLRPLRGYVEIQTLQAASLDSHPAALSPNARALLEEQIRLLGEDGSNGAAGRISSAGRVAANVLRHGGRPGEADELDLAVVRSQHRGDLRILVAAIKGALSGILQVSAAEADPVSHEPQEGAARTLRVDVERIDALVRLTGELTVVKNAIGHAAALAKDGADGHTLAAALKDHHTLLDRVLQELQRSVLSIRVLPLRHVFQRFPRLVREMSAKLGKPARLVTEGDETEADKAIVEALFEPLLHAVRNALDHGIEPAGERAATAKPATGTIRLRATREGEHVLVEVEDDGRGIDVARVRQAAAERRIAASDELAAMADEAVIDLIFAPGFSTASEITGLSGRGVGMDVVRTAVERLGGRVTVESRLGLGTAVRFVLPFTVMMTRVMTVDVGGQAFGIPLDAVVETVRIPRDRIVPVGAARAIVRRNRTIPLVQLAQALGGSGMEATAEANVVITMVGGQLGGIEVERLGERMDVMLKPMEGLLNSLPGLAGTTLLGNGRVLIVLDLQEIFQ
jgi:two-component system chemotaxis sensor kinase CheA